MYNAFNGSYAAYFAGAVSYTHKIFMKLTTGVDFINNLFMYCTAIAE
jgi:hypothetical protein